MRISKIRTPWELAKSSRERAYKEFTFRVMVLATIFGGTCILTIDYFGWIS